MDEPAAAAQVRDAGPPGSAWPELACALLLSLAVLFVARRVDRALEHPPAPELVAVGPVADPHHVHIDAIYGSFAREAAEGGGLRVHNHQTGEPHPPTLARPWDWLIGRLARLGAASASVQPVALFRLDRLFAAFLFPAGCALLLGEVVRRRALRLGALVALAAGGSLYWIAPLRAHAGTWLDGIGGLSGLGFAYPALLVGVPHLALEVAAFAGGLGAALRARRTGRMRWAIVAGAALFLLTAVRPYSAPAALAGAALALVWGRPVRGLPHAALACLPSVPLLVHDALVLRGDTVFRGLDVTRTAPPVVEQLLFLGVPALFVPLLFVPAVRRGLGGPAALPAASRAGLLGALAVLLAVVEGPFVAWQVEAMLPLPLFAVLGAARALDGLERRAAAALGVAALALHVAPSGAYAAEVARRLDDPRAELWMLRDERAALDHLAELAGGAGLVSDAAPIVLLCDPVFGRLVPWLAGVRVYAGHADHTVGFPAKEGRARSFYRYGAGAAGLRAAGVTHVLFAPRTRAGGGDPDALPQLERVFASGDVRLYRVTR